MSDHFALKHVFSNAKSRESMDAFQSQWMAHWMRTSQNPASQVHQYPAIHDEKREEDHNTKQEQTTIQIAGSRKAKRLDADVSLGDISEYKNKWKHRLGGLEVASDVIQSARGMVTENRRIEITNKSLMRKSKDLASPDMKSTWLDSLSFGKLSETSVHENFIMPSLPYFKERQTFQKFDLNEKMDAILSPNTDFVLCDKFRPQLDDKSGYGVADISTSVPHLLPRVLTLPPNEIHFKDKGNPGTAEHQLKPDYFDQKIVPLVRPLHDGHSISSNSMLVKSRGPIRIREEDQSRLPLSHKGFGNTNFTYKEPEHCNYHSYSTFFASEMKMDKTLIAESSGSQCPGQKDGALQLIDDPMIGDFRFPILGEQSKKMKNFFVTGLLPRHSSSQEVMALEDLKCEHHFLHRMPTCCLQDMETQQICTTVDSVEGVPGGQAKFSKTTRHLLITKKNDVNLSKGDQMLKESLVSAELKGKAFHKMLALPTDFCCYGVKEAKFQHLATSGDGEEKEDGNAVVTDLQNESLAETDTMPIDFHQSKNAPACVTSSLSLKDLLAVKSTGKYLEAVASQNKVEIRKEASKLPDMNDEFHADLAAAVSVDGRELSTSRTESLDVEHLLSHVKQPENSNSSLQRGILLDSEPNSRWVKRLRLSASDSHALSSPQRGIPLDSEPNSRWVKRLRLSASDFHALGTKSLKMGDASSSDKVNKLFNRITSYSRTSSEPTLGKCRAKGRQQFDRTAMLLRNIASSGALVKDHRDLSLSHSWIQRWCLSREATAQAGLAPAVAREAENSKFSLEEYERKQFPSIAAMALMGKAVSSFRPCVFRKRGSLVVWNTEGF